MKKTPTKGLVGDLRTRDEVVSKRLGASGDQLAASMLASHGKSRVKPVLDQVDETDREVIALRIFERLNNGEAAEVLGLTKQTTSKRFFRAIERLRETVLEIPGF